jgi:hypothetical protein
MPKRGPFDSAFALHDEMMAQLFGEEGHLIAEQTEAFGAWRRRACTWPTAA